MTETAPVPASSQQFGTTRIAVFAREPLLGQVKSRLATAIGAEQALAVYQAMLQRTAGLVSASALAGWDLWVTSNPDHKSFLSICNKTNIYIQQGTNLGQRMDYTIAHSLRRKGADSVLIIGTDCPALTPEYLAQAAAALQAGNDVVVGPAVDGGYVLIGARRPIPELFEDILWGSEQVMQQTLAKLHSAKLRYQLLETLWDVDRTEDLAQVALLDPPLLWR
jgi:uncharacterized protein